MTCREPTAAELEKQIAERLAALPKWWEASSPKPRRGERVKVAVRVLRGKGKRK